MDSAQERYRLEFVGSRLFRNEAPASDHCGSDQCYQTGACIGRGNAAFRGEAQLSPVDRCSVGYCVIFYAEPQRQEGGDRFRT